MSSEKWQHYFVHVFFKISQLNWPKLKLYVACAVCALIGVVALLVYVDSRISSVEQETRHQLQVAETRSGRRNSHK